MARLVVYLQRTPWGIHPGSAVGLCVARDLADARGAALTALCEGDAGDPDEKLVSQASACGCDELFFVGPRGITSYCKRVQPLHFFTPCTPQGFAAAHKAGLGPAEPIWLDAPPVDLNQLGRVSAVIAGLLPWQAAPLVIEPEYEGDVGAAPLPGWIQGPATERPRSSPLTYVSPQNLDPQTEAALDSLGARAITPDQAASHQEGLLLWLDAGPNGLPSGLGQRPPQAQVMVLAGPRAAASGPNPLATGAHETWKYADWVIAGPWPDAIRELQGTPWKTALG